VVRVSIVVTGWQHCGVKRHTGAMFLQVANLPETLKIKEQSSFFKAMTAPSMDYHKSNLSTRVNEMQSR